MKKRFRFFSQRVLPIVYDDSLSYYEILEKLQTQIIEMGDEIDNNLLIWITEAIPELISEATYDESTGTLEIVLITDSTDEQITDDPIKRISINGISRPVMDEIARKWSGESWLYNKTLCMYGDSTLVVPETYSTIIQGSGIPASVTIRGVSGQSLTNGGYPAIRDAIDLNTFDYVFVCYGINDWSGITKNAWRNAVAATAERIINAGSEPVFVFPWMVYIPTMHSNGFINDKGCDMSAYVDAAIEECEQRKVKYFNLCQLSGVNESNYQAKLTRSANGYYLHEGTALGQYIAKLILNGNYNSGKCYGDRFKDACRTFLPLNWGMKTPAETRALISDLPITWRKGRALTVTSTKVCEFFPIGSGDYCRITGFAKHDLDGGYVDFAYINLYDESAGAQHICRVQTGSDFDFVFKPGNNGGAFKLCAQSSTGGFTLLMDLAIAGSQGETRLSGSSPAQAASPVTLTSKVTLVHGGLFEMIGERINLLPFCVQAAEDMAQGATINVGDVGFYPQHPIYGTCHVGSDQQLYRVRETGEIDLYVLGSAIATGTYLFFDGVDITPTPFLYY